MATAATCLIFLAFLCWIGFVWLRLYQRPAPHGKAAVSSTVQRPLKPRPPADCLACRRPRAASSGNTSPHQPGLPWREVKSRRGAPKRINTDGFACPNHGCAYNRITDAHVYALVGEGTHGKRERIQTFSQRVSGQACGTTFTSRRDTPPYRLPTPSTRVAEVLSALAEGLTVSAAAGTVLAHVAVSPAESAVHAAPSGPLAAVASSGYGHSMALAGHPLPDRAPVPTQTYRRGGATGGALASDG